MGQDHLLLPPVNEVWGKVMFLHLSVILFMWGGRFAHSTVGRPEGRGSPPLDAEEPHTQMQTPLQMQTSWMQTPSGCRAVVDIWDDENDIRDDI